MIVYTNYFGPGIYQLDVDVATHIKVRDDGPEQR